ncbi:hypothetical protein [Phyllobacterium sp. SB3]|uniref:hypothetical protein n=1 Tax=Phyllobacterium sp. SB3 TaxID=3156073 RepID=UPI0032AEC825
MVWLEIGLGITGLLVTAGGVYPIWKKAINEDRSDYPTVKSTYTYRGLTKDWLIVRFITQNNSHVPWEVAEALLTHPDDGKIIDEKAIPRNGPEWELADPDITKLDMPSLTNSLKFARILAPKGTGSVSLINGESERVEDAIWVYMPFHLRTDRVSITLNIRSKEARSRLGSAEINQVITPIAHVHSI